MYCFYHGQKLSEAPGGVQKTPGTIWLDNIAVLTLALLSTEQDVSAADICDRLLIDKSTLSGVLERLDEKGLVVKRPDKNDRRALSISMSPSGSRMADQLSQIPETINEIAMTSMALEERLLLKRLLKDMCV